MKKVTPFVLAILAAVPAAAQLANPNALGVTMGHVHYTVKDVDAQKRFWIDAFGAVEVHNGSVSLIQMPGVYIMFRQGDASGPQEGSIVDHVSFTVKNLKESMADWKARGFPTVQANNPLQCYVVGPEGVRVEILQDPATPRQFQMNHIHLHAVDIPAMEAWYEKTFGFTATKVPMLTSSNLQEISEIPGSSLHFAKEQNALAPTKGRKLDHIGFDVRNLEEFTKRLQAQGIQLEAPIRAIANTRIKVAFLTDPWGTYIELTENLAPIPAAGQSAAIPRLPDGKPDFNGVWDHPRVADVTKDANGCGSGGIGCRQEGSGELSYTAEGLAKWKDTARYDYTARCLPYGYTRGWGSSAPIEIVQTPERFAVFFEIGSTYQVVPTDGRSHPRDLELTWAGNSVGRYEGDTLVVDSVGFNEKTYIDTVEHPHSEQLHLTERFKYIDPRHISQEVTFEDPRIYEKPFRNTRILARMQPGQELMEYVCMENNKELMEGHLVGHQETL